MQYYGPVQDFRIIGKIVLITGGGSGIGFALARLCHERGAQVLIGDLKLVPEAKDYIAKATQNEIVFQHCDVSSWQALHDLISASAASFGDVPDVYVPCAGVFEPRWSNFWSDSEEESYKLIQINTNHPIKLTRLAMRALAGAEKQGVVALVASSAGIRGNYLAALYASSKHAIVGFTKSMGQADKEEGVKIVCVLPGIVQSPLWEDREDDIAEISHYQERLKTAVQPSDIANTLLQMIESAEYDGGSCVLKTKLEQRIVGTGYTKSVGKYDPSPRLEPDLTRIRSSLRAERGKKWA